MVVDGFVHYSREYYFFYYFHLDPFDGAFERPPPDLLPLVLGQPPALPSPRPPPLLELLFPPFGILFLIAK